MQIEGWRYYNHAAIPTTAPYETVDVTAIEDGSIWELDGKPIFARWTSNFDCGYETSWWYVIKDAPFEVMSLPAKEQKRIRQALRKCHVKKIAMTDYADDLYRVYRSAVMNYENSYAPTNEENFAKLCLINDTYLDCWAGFDNQTGRLIGYMLVKDNAEYAEISVAKFDPEHKKLQVSDALYHDVLDFYLNKQGKKFVCSGERSISHKTGTQAYKIKRFGYRKAYCKLHVEYNKRIKWLIKLVYPFRGIARFFDKVTIVHNLNAVLLMEEIRRGFKNDK